MEQFKKSFSADQQKSRLDIIKHTSLSLSTHDGFGLSQETTQQDLSNTVKNAEKGLLHEIPEHQKLVSELLKAQSEYHEVCAKEKIAEGLSQERKLALDKYIDICKEKTKQLNKIYELGIQNQELAQIQELFSTFLEFKQNLNEPMQKLDKELQVYSKNILQNNKYIDNLIKQIEMMQKEKHTSNSKPLSHWVETSQRFLEIGDYKEIQKEYQKIADTMNDVEIHTNVYINERNTYAKLLGKPIKSRQEYEKNVDENDIPPGTSLDSHAVGLDLKVLISSFERESQRKACNKAFGSDMEVFIQKQLSS